MLKLIHTGPVLWQSFICYLPSRRPASRPWRGFAARQHQVSIDFVLTGKMRAQLFMPLFSQLKKVLSVKNGTVAARSSLVGENFLPPFYPPLPPVLKQCDLNFYKDATE